MAYFSNGTEGMMYQAEYCDNCINYRERDPWPELKWCSIWDLHMHHNSDQNIKTKLGKALINVLETLIPTDKETHFASECSMFIRADEVSEPEAEYRDKLLFTDEPTFGML